jgi:uncharacterized protein (TIGR00255 family)
MSVAQSMTGFAMAESSVAGYEIKIEIRSLNSRYLDINSKIPFEYYPLENELRSILKTFFTRGRLELFITRWSSSVTPELQVNKAVFDLYWSKVRDLAEAAGVSADQRGSAFAAIIAKNEIFQHKTECVTAEEKDCALALLKKTCEQLKDNRSSEGRHLLSDIATRFANLRSIKDSILNDVSGNFQKIKVNLQSRLAELVGNNILTPEKLTEQAAYLAERQDINEEIVRISAHLLQLEAMIHSVFSGKKCEFLIQELNREFNTISSKTPLLEVQQFCVNAKIELDKMREQALNLE